MRPETQADRSARIERVLAHMSDHPEEEMTLAGLARHAGMSPYHFGRMFRAEVGESPVAYLKRRRLEAAALRLLYSPRSVSKVAHLAGYRTHESFTRAFGAAFGASPSRFREAPGLEAGALEYRLAVERFRERHVAYLPRVGPYDGIVAGAERLLEWAVRRGLPGSRVYLGIYYDDQRVTDASRTRYEAAIAVPEGVEGSDGVRVRTLPDCEYAVAHVRRPVERCSPVYPALYRDFLPRLGRRPASHPPFERYDENEVSVFVPLAP